MKAFIQPIHSLSRILHDSANVALGNHTLGKARDLSSTELQEEASSFIVSVPVPGMSKDDLSVYMEGRVLVVSTKSQEKFETRIGSKRRDFKHSFVVPNNIDTDRIHAKCRHGLLTITLEKIKSEKKHTVIKVLGGENDRRHTGRMVALWDKIKEKIIVRKFARNTRQIGSY